MIQCEAEERVQWHEACRGRVREIKLKDKVESGRLYFRVCSYEKCMLSTAGSFLIKCEAGPDVLMYQRTESEQ